MATLTRTAALSAAQRMPIGPTDLSLLAFPQQPTRSYSGDASVTIRPAGPNDAEMLQTYVRELSASARHNRFLAALRELPRVELATATGMNGPNRGACKQTIVERGSRRCVPNST